MTIHDEAEAALRAVYDTALARSQASIDGLTLEKATLTGTVKELEFDIEELRARIAELETKPVEQTPPPTIPLPKTICGPTGKHWASNTPRPVEATSAYVVACDWKSIGEGYQKAAAAGDRDPVVRVRPGVLPGNGAGSTVKPVLSGLHAVRPGGRKILIVPDEGVGSVTFSGSIRLHNMRGAAFMGFDLGEQLGVVLTGCQNFTWGYSVTRFTNITNNAGDVTKNVSFVECVTTEVGGFTASDRSAFRNVDSGTIDGVLVEGGYYAPVYKKDGEGAHLDMLQFSGTNRFDNIIIRDTAGFAASNQGLIVTNTTTLTLDNTLLVGGEPLYDRYPQPEGAYKAPYAGSPWPMNGTPEKADIINGSVLVGTPKYSAGWSANYDSTSGVVKSITKAELDTKAPIPTAARRKEMWSKII